MIALVLSLAMGAVGAQSTPSLLFDHGSFCLQMQETAGQDEVRTDAAIDRWTKHGGSRLIVSTAPSTSGRCSVAL